MSKFTKLKRDGASETLWHAEDGRLVARARLDAHTGSGWLEVAGEPEIEYVSYGHAIQAADTLLTTKYS